MYLFVVQYDANDTPTDYKLWKCEGASQCSYCLGRFFCITTRMIWIGNRKGIVVRQHERELFGAALTIKNAMFIYEDTFSLRYLPEEERENLI